jgi:hypothetical protein
MKSRPTKIKQVSFEGFSRLLIMEKSDEVGRKWFIVSWEHMSVICFDKSY